MNQVEGAEESLRLLKKELILRMARRKSKGSTSTGMVHRLQRSLITTVKSASILKAIQRSLEEPRRSLPDTMG